MSDSKRNFGSTIPELADIIKKYGCGLGHSPPFVILGQIASGNQTYAGVLAVAKNEMYAHQIKREVVKLGGNADIKYSEYHPQQNFSLKDYKSRVRQQLVEQETQREAIQKAAGGPNLKLV